MTRVVQARQGEPIDRLVWRVTGRGSPAIEAVLAANPGLAARGQALPEGLDVVIPDLAEAPADGAADPAAMIQLWD
ncbi:tail protein X [Phenylobacterium sp.]|uniref:tail protein X n=1 Tax=Phenylobacterium sp. TaxID=1871053 RepID=UPI00301E17F8